jgi:simple sugar transport system permease protein
MARTDSANPNYGASYVLVTILVVVLGGVAVTGGSGRVSGVIVALVLLQILSTGLNMLLVGHGDSNFFRDLAWGAVLLTALALPRISLRRRALPRSAPINQKAVNPGEIG